MQSAHLDVIQRKIIQHEIEEAALKKEDDKLSKEHLQEIQKELAEMRENFSALQAKWQNEKDAIGVVQKLREEIEDVNAEIEAAERKYDLNKAAELKYGKLPQLQKELAEQEKIAEEAKSDSTLLRDKVTEEEIAKTVSTWTKIPVQRLAEGESKRLARLEQTLHKRVVGQEEAVAAVAKAVKRGRVGLKDPNRPTGSFLFLGPPGVGKTELSKALAEAVFGTEQALIRVDMSEYMEEHSVS